MCGTHTMSFAYILTFAAHADDRHHWAATVDDFCKAEGMGNIWV